MQILIGIAFLENLPRRSKSSIASRASHLNLSKNNYFWTKQEIEILKQNYSSCALDELCNMLHNKYTICAIQSKAQKLGFTVSMEWKDEEINLLKDTYEKLPIDKVMEMLPGRTYDSIVNMARKLGIQSNFYLTRIYSDKDIQFLKENWEQMSDVQLAEQMNRSRGSVKNMRRNLNLLRQERDRDLTYESLAKFFRGNIYDWKLRSMQKCNFQCIVTKSKNFEIHHLYSFHLILEEFIMKYNVDKNLDINKVERNELDKLTTLFNEFHNTFPLGVCISKELHDLFHYRYGKNNTPDQFWEFIEEYKTNCQ